ncbi:hypothetical protein ABT127_23530 [Streptomyces sp. NPDC001904]|uniref:hypothetical protein n=1 Tax=Streptomyces sp. NPDC001904 TaxID=3154531 RepID=UPI003327FF41
MKILSVRRGGRPGAWTGAALVVLLAALLHLLACAHGPAADGAGRADTIAATSAAVSHATTAAHRTDSGGDGDARCRGMDEPTAQPPRDRAPAETVRSAPAAEPRLSSPAPSHGRPPGAGRHTECSAPGDRARLGVWRT